MRSRGAAPAGCSVTEDRRPCEVSFITGSARPGLLVKPARSPHTRRVQKIVREKERFHECVTKTPYPEKISGFRERASKPGRVLGKLCKPDKIIITGSPGIPGGLQQLFRSANPCQPPPSPGTAGFVIRGRGVSRELFGDPCVHLPSTLVARVLETWRSVPHPHNEAIVVAVTASGGGNALKAWGFGCARRRVAYEYCGATRFCLRLPVAAATELGCIGANADLPAMCFYGID